MVIPALISASLESHHRFVIPDKSNFNCVLQAKMQWTNLL